MSAIRPERAARLKAVVESEDFQDQFVTKGPWTAPIEFSLGGDAEVGFWRLVLPSPDRLVFLGFINGGHAVIQISYWNPWELTAEPLIAAQIIYPQTTEAQVKNLKTGETTRGRWEVTQYEIGKTYKNKDTNAGALDIYLGRLLKLLSQTGSDT